MALEARCRNCGNTGYDMFHRLCKCKIGRALEQMASAGLGNAPFVEPVSYGDAEAVQPADEPRAIVRAFALAMERKLAANDGVKGGWRDDDVDELQRLLRGEMREFDQTLDILVTCQLTDAPDDLLAESRRALLDEAADVANYLAMLCDVVGALPSTDERGR